VATRDDHEKFCRNDEWERVRDARGKTGTHHVTYRLVLHDGRILRTRISHPVDRTVYGPSLWSHILRDQLEVVEPQFWACVKDAVRPDRGVPAPPAHTIPVQVVYQLLHDVGLASSDVAAMTKDEAIARLNRYWTEGS
jgi:hypothetical protein